ncbi:MAG: hypothetical protein JWM11_3685, partial [Planctomycetaceae bacterium]|nr:hypothetical protein [Planctomycetaceae bacterium]
MTRHNAQDYGTWDETSHEADSPARVTSESNQMDDDEWNRAVQEDTGDAASPHDGTVYDYDVNEFDDVDDDHSDEPDAVPEYATSENDVESVDAATIECSSSASAHDDEPVDVIIEPDAEVEYEPLTSRWMAGLVASLVLHMWLFSTLSSVTVEDREYEAIRPIDSKMGWDEPEPELLEKVAEYELANPNDLEKDQQTALNARSIGLIQSEKPVQEAAPQLEVADALEMRESAPVYDIPEGMEVDESIVVQGTTGEGIIQLDAALDRVTWEIAANLKERKVLVVWLLDSSGSLIEQRKAVAKRMRRIYGELHALETVGQIPNQDKPILSAVVTFGEGMEFLTPNPTANVDDIVSLFEKAPTDQSGVENVFGAVRRITERWGGLRASQGRRLLIMAITDEAGDDYSQHLNVAISMLNRVGGRAYVIGPPAVFGKRQGFVPY